MGETEFDDEWVFAGRYRLDAPIGSGGMGEVWKGYDQQLDRRVAIKLMQQPSAGASGTPESASLAHAAGLDRERFRREIRTMAQLELPGVPSVYDVGVDESSGRIFLVMQLVYGQTLQDLITARDYKTDPMPVSWAAAIAAQAASTLVDVHRVDVVHRDIKPSNLMVSVNGLVKILDFGIAILQGASALPKLTQIGKTVGTPPYMSREQVLRNPVGPATDVYALGCVLHEMVTGRLPYIETPSQSYEDQHVNAAPPSVRALRPEVPAFLDDLVVGMLAKQPVDRPDAGAVYQALVPLIGSGSPSPGGDPDPRRPFLRPLAPMPRRQRPADSPGHTPRAAVEPLTIDEFLEIHERVARLIQGSQVQQAIDLLEEAVERAAHDPALSLETKIELATTLYVADQFGRAAAILDAILPRLAGRDEAAELRYYAGVSHAEIGEIERAIDYLTALSDEADPRDSLYREATYQLGMMLPAVGRGIEGLRHLESLRPILVSAYGADSVHVSTLDRRIAQLRDRINNQQSD